METLNLKFYDCASHGYLQVSWTDFVNIFKKYDYYPSECSYKGQGYVYLEEDIPVKFTSSYELNSDKCEFTVHGISFFDKDFLDTAIEKLL